MYDAIINFVFSRNTLIYYYGIPAALALAYRLKSLHVELRRELAERRFRSDAGEAWGGHLNVGDIVSCFVLAALPVVNIVIAIIGVWHFGCGVTSFFHEVLDIKLVAPVKRLTPPSRRADRD